MSESITLFGHERPFVLHDPQLPEDEQEFVTPDGRYFVDASIFMGSLHSMLHDLAMPLFDLRPDFSAEDGGHVLVNLATEAVDAVLMELAVNLPAFDPRA